LAWNSDADIHAFRSFNFGSPWNISAGRGTADLSALTKFYQDEKEGAEQQRIERLKRNNGRSVYD
jgi:hypothetical protein